MPTQPNSALPRALNTWRRGQPVRIGAQLVQAAEMFLALGRKPRDGAMLLISPQRAARLGLAATVQRIALDEAACTALPGLLGLEALAKPVAAEPDCDDWHGPLLRAFKQAGLIPAAVLEPASELDEAIELTPSQLLAADAMPPVQLVHLGAASVPLEGIGSTRIHNYRDLRDGVDHLAIVIGEPSAVDAPLVRVHSSCLTGDVLSSLRCDCGSQLRMALERIRAAGTGVLCYLQQEGRGIGITAKLHAYCRQDEGLDTVDANLELGFGQDERDFAVAAEMLAALGLGHVTLLTNNPEKRRQLEGYGIKVDGRETLVTEPTLENNSYLDTKRTRMGHQYEN